MMKRICLCLCVLFALAACGTGSGFKLQSGEDLTVTCSVDEPVAGTALEIFGKDVRTVLSASCLQAEQALDLGR